MPLTWLLSCSLIGSSLVFVAAADWLLELRSLKGSYVGDNYELTLNVSVYFVTIHETSVSF